MNVMDFFAAIGGVSDKYVDESDRTHKRAIWIAVLGTAACLAMVIGAMVFFNDRDNTKWPLKEVHIEQSEQQNTGGEIAILPDWEELDINQKYPYILVDGVEFTSRDNISPNYIQDMLFSGVEASGIDMLSGVTHKITTDIYEIQGISQDCAVAVSFPEVSDEFYVYINSEYSPDTLEQFVNDLNLRENMLFGSVWYSYEKESGEYATVEFSGLENYVVWDMLLDDLTAKNVDNYDSMNFFNKMSISVFIPVLGYENISLSVTEDGYITTNILDTGKAFYIGEDKTDMFIEYVLNNCQGYEIIYIQDDEGIPE